MSNFEVKTGTHIVIKVEDLRKYTTEIGRLGLQTVQSAINSGRLNDGKKLNEYIVVNTSEPYSNEIRKVIKRGEEAKEICRLLREHLKGELVLYWKESNTFGTERYILVGPEVYIKGISPELKGLIDEFYAEVK